jgi:hypothetical protein
MHCLNRKDNAVVLSETIDENAVQTLLDLFIADKFPKQCDEWNAAKKDISDFYVREQTRREHNVFEELASKEHEMQRVLRDAVVEDVIALFPCVLFVTCGPWSTQAKAMFRSLERDRLISSHTWQSREGEAGENLKSLSRSCTLLIVFSRLNAALRSQGIFS